MNRLLITATLVIAVLFGGSRAGAGPIYVSHNEMGPYGYNFYTGGDLGDWPSDYNGQMIITANLGDSTGSPTFDISVWCIDQIGYIGLGDNPNINNDSGIIYNVGSVVSGR